MNQSIVFPARLPERIGSLPWLEPYSAVRLPVNLTADIDAWANDNKISRSEAIRRLVEIGLKAKK